MKVLSSLRFERDFKHLLTPANLQEVFNLLEEFILSKVPHLNFKRSGGARAKGWALSRLLYRMKEASEEMSGGDASDAFLLPPPPWHASQA